MWRDDAEMASLAVVKDAETTTTPVDDMPSSPRVCQANLIRWRRRSCATGGPERWGPLGTGCEGVAIS